MEKIKHFINAGYEVCSFIAQGAGEMGAAFAKAVGPLGGLVVFFIGTAVVAGGVALTVHCIKQHKENKVLYASLGRPLIPQDKLPPQARLKKDL